MIWHVSHRFAPRAVRLADRHYSRRKIGSPQFVAPGRCLVLATESADAVWVTSAPLPEYTKHDWPGAWVCTFFRNESEHKASTLIRQAVSATLSAWGPLPGPGFISFVDPARVRPKANPGHCYVIAGFRQIGATGGGHGRNPLLVFGLDPSKAPEPRPAIGAQRALIS
jgi:hypothetical protein